MDREKFEALVRAAWDGLPDDFKRKMENVEIVVEDWVDMGTAAKLGLRARGRLLGLYQGVPLKDRSGYYGMVLPDKITLFRKSIEAVCSERGLDIAEEVSHVLKHEIAHHFGITDGRLRDLDVY